MSLVTREQIETAAASIKGVAVRTPLLPAPWLCDELGADVRLKCENLQPAGAFKIRGAYNMLSRLSEEERRRGVITYSSGNHGQAMALAAKLYGVKAVVVMPTTAPSIKIEGAKAFGAEVVLEGTTSTERYNRAVALSNEHGYVIVPPFDHPDIIAGQGTLAKEVLEEWPEVSAMLVPIGGGGMASGVAAYVKQVRPEVKVYGVEPENSDAMYQSLRAHHPVTLSSTSSVADGLLPVRPGDLTYEHAAEFIDGIFRVSDEEIRRATRDLVQRSKLVVEFSGAATVAALRQYAAEFRGANAAAVLSGGNLDPAKLAELIS